MRRYLTGSLPAGFTAFRFKVGRVKLEVQRGGQAAMNRWMLGFAALFVASWSLAISTSEAQEEGSTPGAIPNPGTYQGSMQLQQQSDRQDQQFRQQQQQGQRQYNSPGIRGAGPSPSGAPARPAAQLQLPALPRVVPAPSPLSPANSAALAAANRGDFQTAKRIWEPLAQHGDMIAEYNIGVMYDYGKGAPQNDAIAFRLYTAAASHGMCTAMNNLGVSYSMGKGISKDLIQAYKWLRLASVNCSAAKDRTNSTNALGTLVPYMTQSQAIQGELAARSWRPRNSGT
jgi:hypothetical protein